MNGKEIGNLVEKSHPVEFSVYSLTLLNRNEIEALHRSNTKAEFDHIDEAYYWAMIALMRGFGYTHLDRDDIFSDEYYEKSSDRINSLINSNKESFAAFVFEDQLPMNGEKLKDVANASPIPGYAIAMQRTKLIYDKAFGEENFQRFSKDIIIKALEDFESMNDPNITLSEKGEVVDFLKANLLPAAK